LLDICLMEVKMNVLSLCYSYEICPSNEIILHPMTVTLCKMTASLSASQSASI